MGRILAGALVVVWGLFMLSAPSVLAGPLEGLPCNGNFDGDLDVDAEDVTEFLIHFGRGQYIDPCPPLMYAPVPKTWQTICYDETGTQRDCLNTGEDGEYQKGVEWPDPRFADNEDGTVTDNLTGLMWLKDANCITTNYPTFDIDGAPGDGLVTWQHALDFVTGINDGTYPDCGAGSTDWRLPHIKELSSLIDFDNYGPALPNGHPFSAVQFGGYYWSGTSFHLTPLASWCIHMNDGDLNQIGKVNIHFVWPVRGGH